MTRTELEKYLGQKVELSIFDGTVISNSASYKKLQLLEVASNYLAERM